MEDDEPELWVLEMDDEHDEAASDDPAVAPAPTDAPTELTSTLTSDDVAGDDWADTSWLDELAPQPGRDAAPGSSPTAPAGARPTAPPATPTGQADDAATAPRGDRASTSADEFAGLRGDAASSHDRVPRRPEAATEPRTPVDDPTPAQRSRRSRPSARGDEVSEFLRELSRLALDDD